ncbi:MAG: hypothetical protein ACNYPD_03580 [Candidatus Halichondribacter symbioticus]
MSKIEGGAVLVALFFTTSATAQLHKKPYGITPSITSMGMMIEGHAMINDRFGLRVPLAGFRYNTNDIGLFTLRDQADGLVTDGRIGIGGVGVLFDWYPQRGRLRLSAGAIVPFWHVRGNYTGSADAPIRLGGVDYTDVSVRTIGRFANPITPMIAIGYGGNLAGNASFVFDIGFLLNNGYKTSITQTAGAPIPAANLTAELAKVTANLNKPTFLRMMFPFIKFGVTFAF